MAALNSNRRTSCNLAHLTRILRTFPSTLEKSANCGGCCLTLKLRRAMADNCISVQCFGGNQFPLRLMNSIAHRLCAGMDTLAFGMMRGMSKEILIAILLCALSVAAGIAAMAAPLYFSDVPHWIWGCLFYFSILLFVISALWVLHMLHKDDRRRPWVWHTYWSTYRTPRNHRQFY